MAPLKARQEGAAGLLDDEEEPDALFEESRIYPSCILSLNEANVQAIFNRCLAEDGTAETTASSLYFGLEKEDDGLRFVKSQLQTNQKNIQYLAGQLKPVHEGQHILTLEDMAKNYQGNVRARKCASLMQLLYLGSSDTLTIFSPLIARWNGTILNMPITPTLAPKGPAFPA